MERVVRERMTITDPDQATPSALINIRPVVAAMKEFFGGCQLSQFMDQTNPLAELTHKRTPSALGPGGLSRDRAGFDVRDVHHSHYGRICPIETPEGPNIGLIGSLATYGRINDYGFIETPYRKVRKLVSDRRQQGRRHRRRCWPSRWSPMTVARPIAERARRSTRSCGPRSRSTRWPAPRAPGGHRRDRVPRRRRGGALLHRPGQRAARRRAATSSKSASRSATATSSACSRPRTSTTWTSSPKQIVSVATSLIPFLEHDDANRALMGSNMQRQAVPLLRPSARWSAPAWSAAPRSTPGRWWWRRAGGTVVSVTSAEIMVERDEGDEGRHSPEEVPALEPGHLHQPAPDRRCRRARGQGPGAGRQLLETDQGELALGQNILVAFMSWEGYNYEDAIVLSERWCVRTSSPRSTSRSTRSRPATPSSARRRSPATSRTSARRASGPGRGRDHPHRRRSARPATSWSARSRPRARPS